MIHTSRNCSVRQSTHHMHLEEKTKQNSRIFKCWSLTLNGIFHLTATYQIDRYFSGNQVVCGLVFSIRIDWSESIKLYDSYLTAFVHFGWDFRPNSLVLFLAPIFWQWFIIQTTLTLNYFHKMNIEILIVAHFIHWNTHLVAINGRFKAFTPIWLGVIDYFALFYRK